MTNSEKPQLTSNEVVERISEHSDADACQRTLDLLNDAATDIKRLQEVIARCYMRLQCADVPREPWHWEVCTTLDNTGIPAQPSKQCPYCLHPVRLDGSILHAGGCAGLDTVELTRLQYDALTKAHGNETSERQPAVAVLREMLENISTVRPLEHFPAVTALAYCREKAIEALNATSAFQEIIVGEYEADGKVNMASSPLPEGTKLYARLPLRHSKKAGEQR